MKVNFNLSISISGLSVNTSSKRYLNGAVDKEQHDENTLDNLSIDLNGSSEMKAIETREFIFGVMSAVKIATEVKMNETKKSDTNFKTNVEKLPKSEIKNIDYVDDVDKEDIKNG